MRILAPIVLLIPLAAGGHAPAAAPPLACRAGDTLALDLGFHGPADGQPVAAAFTLRYPADALGCVDLRPGHGIHLDGEPSLSAADGVATVTARFLLDPARRLGRVGTLRLRCLAPTGGAVRIEPVSASLTMRRGTVHTWRAGAIEPPRPITIGPARPAPLLRLSTRAAAPSGGSR
jgi:hypothetical protein